MRAALTSIEEAIDRKYLITKTLKGQAEAGTLVHIMEGRSGSDGITVKYRVSSSGQDFVATFPNIGQFSKWAVADNFLARYQQSLTKRDIKQYLKMRDSTAFSAFGFILIPALLIVWLIMAAGFFFTDFQIWQLAVGGVCLSIMVYFLIFMYHRHLKDRIMTNIYNKVATNWQGGVVIQR